MQSKCSRRDDLESPGRKALFHLAEADNCFGHGYNKLIKGRAGKLKIGFSYIFFSGVANSFTVKV
jgi:hypothetical protein